MPLGGGEMKHSMRLGILCVVVLLSSCTPIYPGSQDTQVLPERIVRPGFSLKPPDEKGWMFPPSGRLPPDVLLVMWGDNPDETRVVRGSLSRIPGPFAVVIAGGEDLAKNGYGRKMITDALADVVRQANANNNPQRYRAVKLDVEPHLGKGTDCVKSFLTYEDNAPRRASGKADPMIFAGLTFTCIHPNARRILVSVEYSHRYNLGQLDPQFLEKAMNVLSSIEFAAR